MLPATVISLLVVPSLKEVRSLRILGVTLDYKSTFETQLREILSKTQGVRIVYRAGKLFQSLWSSG